MSQQDSHPVPSITERVEQICALWWGHLHVFTKWGKGGTDNLFPETEAICTKCQPSGQMFAMGWRSHLASWRIPALSSHMLEGCLERTSWSLPGFMEEAGSDILVACRGRSDFCFSPSVRRFQWIQKPNLLKFPQLHSACTWVVSVLCPVPWFKISGPYRAPDGMWSGKQGVGGSPIKTPSAPRVPLDTEKLCFHFEVIKILG